MKNGSGILEYGNSKESTIVNVYNTGSAAYGILGSSSVPQISDAYYCNNASLKGSSSEIADIIAKTSATMQTKSFAESLGEAFVYNEGGYPLLAWEAELQQEPLMGDINLDGIFDVADIKLLQDYLVCRETLTAEQGAVADVCADGVLDVFDLSVLKRMYLEQSETA